jgi:hypothetical protein
MHVCSGTTADYSVTLPPASGNTGKFIGLRMASSLTKLVTLDANASELIDGSLTRIMWAGEFATLMCDGVGWVKVSGRSIPMRCSARDGGADQFVAANTIVELNISAIEADPVGMVSLASNSVTIRRSSSYSVRVFAAYYDFSGGSEAVDASTKLNGATDWRRDRRGVTYGGGSYATQCYPTLVVPSIDLAQGDVIIPTLHVGAASAKTLAGIGVFSFIEVAEIPTW